jgi:hypothetical protein
MLARRRTPTRQRMALVCSEYPPPMWTDKRELLSDEHRVYTIIDGRTVPQLEQAVATARQQEGKGVLVINGGGNRAAVDDLLASISDAVILPFTADDDSVYVGNPHAPGNWAISFAASKAVTVDEGYIEKLETLYPARLLTPTPATHSIRDFLLRSFNGTLLPPAQRYCRALARQVTDVFNGCAKRG